MPLIDGYVSVEWTASELKNGILHLQKEGILFPRTLFTCFFRHLHSYDLNKDQKQSIIFTSKEQMILKMLCEGRINKEIATTLRIKEKKLLKIT